jgi:hypothetical protein
MTTTEKWLGFRLPDNGACGCAAQRQIYVAETLMDAFFSSPEWDAGDTMGRPTRGGLALDAVHVADAVPHGGVSGHRADWHARHARSSISSFHLRLRA